MTEREAIRLRRRIEKSGHRVTIKGLRVYGRDAYGRGGSYSLDIVDHATGYPAVIHSPEDWNERIAR